MDNIKVRLAAVMEYHRGRCRAITRRELRETLDFHDDRTLRLAKSELISAGLPILSRPDHPAGYFLPANMTELADGVSTIESYIIELAALKRSLERGGSLYLKPAQQVCFKW